MRLRGFSLIELVVVLAVIVVWGAIAVPRFGSAVRHQRLNAAVRRVARDLSDAQRRAYFTSHQVTVRFDTDDNRYEVEGTPDPDHPGEAYWVYLGEDPYRARLISVDFGDSALKAKFDAFGMPIDGGLVTIGVGGVTRSVSVDQDSGRIEVP